MASAPPPANLYARRRLDYLVLEYLKKRAGDLSGPDAAACSGAVAALAGALGVNPMAPEDRHKFGGLDATLPELVAAGMDVVGAERTNEGAGTREAKFARYLETVTAKGMFAGLAVDSLEYKERMTKVQVAFDKRFPPVQAADREQREKLAETCKANGNTKLSAGDYAGAIACYDEALEHSKDGPNSHIYYANRAAALAHLKEFARAAEDCTVAVALKPDYAKAYSRLAHAKMCLGQKEEAVAAANKALELEPGNAVALATLKEAESSQKSSAVQPGNLPGGMPGGFPGMPGGGDGMDLAGMMNNPQIQAMMQNPEMMRMAQQMMSDPNAMQGLMGMLGGGGGGAPPDLARMMAQMGGGKKGR